MKALSFFLPSFLVAARVAAQDTFFLAWSAISGGGGPSTGAAEFTLGGASVGQFAAGDADTGTTGEFDLNSGYWTFEIAPPADLSFTMRLDGGIVVLNWREDAPPVVLERSTDLELWVPVDPQPEGPPFQEPWGPRRFYRLVPALE